MKSPSRKRYYFATFIGDHPEGKANSCSFLQTKGLFSVKKFSDLLFEREGIKNVAVLSYKEITRYEYIVNI